MANRSYLYSINFDRTLEEIKDGDKIVGLSEYRYYTPLSYKILVSQDPHLSRSVIWEYEHPIAIQGNFEKGQEKLLKFLNELQKMDLFDKEELEKRIEKAQQFLNQHQLQNSILENGEIYELDERDAEDQNLELFERDILQIDQCIDEFLNDVRTHNDRFQQLKWQVSELSKPKSIISKVFSPNRSKKIEALNKEIEDIEFQKWFDLGINYWSNILYYDFELLNEKSDSSN